METNFGIFTTFCGKVSNVLVYNNMFHSVLLLNSIAAYDKIKNDVSYPFNIIYLPDDKEYNFSSDNEYFFVDIGIQYDNTFSFYFYRKTDKYELFGDDLSVDLIPNYTLFNVINMRYLT